METAKQAVTLAIWAGDPGGNATRAYIVASGMKKSLVAVVLMAMVGVAGAKATGQRTWAKLQVGDLEVKASMDRDAVEEEGGATVTMSACDREIQDGMLVVDVYLVHKEANGSASERKVIRGVRTSFDTDCKPHDVSVAVGETGKALENYAVLVRVVDGEDADSLDDGAMVKVTNSSRHDALLSLGKR